MTESQLPVTLQMGKQGLTESLVVELREQVRRRKVVRARLLKTAREIGGAQNLAAEWAERSGVRLIEVRGHTATFAEPIRSDHNPGTVI